MLQKIVRPNDWHRIWLKSWPYLHLTVEKVPFSHRCTQAKAMNYHESHA